MIIALHREGNIQKTPSDPLRTTNDADLQQQQPQEQQMLQQQQSEQAQPQQEETEEQLEPSPDVMKKVNMVKRSVTQRLSPKTPSRHLGSIKSNSTSSLNNLSQIL